MIHWLLLGVAAFFALSWGFGIRTMVRSGQGVTYSTVFTALFWMASLLFVFFSGQSAFHLLWLFPLGLVLGLLGMVTFPFNLVVVPAAKVYASIWSVGLNQQEVATNTALHDYIAFRLISLGDATSEERKRIVREEVEKHRDYIVKRMIELQSQGYGKSETVDRVAQAVGEETLGNT